MTVALYEPFPAYQLTLADGDYQRIDALIGECSVEQRLESRGMVYGIIGNQQAAGHQAGNN